jgi:hypothetical protein
MLFFSPLLLGITYLLHYSSKRYTSYSYFSPPLLHIPYKLGPINDCILIYEWFYNIFFQHHISSTSIQSSKKPPKFIKQPLPWPVLSLHHLLFFIYIFINILLVYYIYNDTLPLTYLSVLPSITIFIC